MLGKPLAKKSYPFSTSDLTYIALILISYSYSANALHAIIMNTLTFSLGLLFWTSTAAASGRYCSWPSVYNIATQTAVWTDPELVAGVFVGPSSTTGTIAAGYTYTTSWTITGGITGSYAL